MNPQRLAIKFFSAEPIERSELEPYIGLFHRFIQEASLPGLLLDVADYAHVPDGPGILLVGHDVDYGIDLVEGRSGLLTTRKRNETLGVAELFRDTLARSLAAARAVEADSSLRFDTSEVQISFPDRGNAPNRAEVFEAVVKEIEALARAVFGDGARFDDVAGSEPRRMLTLRVGGDGADLATLAGRLEGA